MNNNYTIFCFLFLISFFFLLAITILIDICIKTSSVGKYMDHHWQPRRKTKVYACVSYKKLTFVCFCLSFKRRMADSLTKYGLYIDDLSKICILEPEVANQTNKLKEECQNFVTRIVEFQKNCNKFIDLTDNWANEVEKEKMRTIGARNLLRSVEKQRDAQKQQIQALIMEKSMELERLRIQYDSLKKIEMEQIETIEHLTVN